MSIHSRNDSVRYKSLGFLGYPDYRIGDDGSVWHKIRGNRSKIDENDVKRIMKMHATGKHTQEFIAGQFGISACNVCNLLAGRTWKNLGKWRRVKGDPDQDGYTRMFLGHRGSKRKRWGAHVLVLEAFAGPRPLGMHGIHKNENRNDNRLENLKWGSPIQIETRTIFSPEKIKVHPDGSKERWRDVVGYEGLYRVSDWGRIRSVERKAPIGGGSVRRVRSRILKYAYLNPKKLVKSYLVVNLSKRGRAEICLIHRLVLEAFVSPCPRDMQACHNDGDPQNNRLENLRWDTLQSNVDDCIPHGTRTNIQGENHYNAKLSNVAVDTIRRLFRWGFKQKTLAGLFGVGYVQIHRIVRNKQRIHN